MLIATEKHIICNNTPDRTRTCNLQSRNLLHDPVVLQGLVQTILASIKTFFKSTIINLDFSIAQLVERKAVNFHVLGSIPSREAGRLV